jgi:hypothetical protein
MTDVTAWTAAVFPGLVLMLCLERVARAIGLAWRGWPLLLMTAAIASGVLLLPIGGLAAARWIAGVLSNVSIPFTGMLAVRVWERAFGVHLFSAQDRTAGWAFGAVGGLVLYPMALGVGTRDPYSWGWELSPLFVSIAMLTAWLIWKQNRFGLLLLLAAGAFQLHLLESSNYWDYLLDPIYCVTSFVALGRGLLTARVRLMTPRSAP